MNYKIVIIILMSAIFSSLSYSEEQEYKNAGSRFVKEYTIKEQFVVFRKIKDDIIDCNAEGRRLSGYAEYISNECRENSTEYREYLRKFKFIILDNNTDYINKYNQLLIESYADFVLTTEDIKSIYIEGSKELSFLALIELDKMNNDFDSYHEYIFSIMKKVDDSITPDEGRIIFEDKNRKLNRIRKVIEFLEYSDGDAYIILATVYNSRLKRIRENSVIYCRKVEWAIGRLLHMSKKFRFKNSGELIKGI